MPSAEKFLIVQTAFIGDVILATPLAQAVRARFAPCQVDFMVIPAAANLLDRNSSIDRVLVFDKRGEQRGAAALWRFAKALRAEKYDVAIVPHRSLRSALLVWLARIPQRIGFDRSAGAFLFTQRVRYQEKHEVERNLDLLQPFGTIPEKLKPRVEWDESDAARVAEFIKNVDTKRTWCALAPGSVWATKRWPADRFARLALTLIAELHATIFLIGGKSDAGLCNEIQQSAGENCLNLAGMLSLRQSAALLDRCAVLISNDSAPTHLGVATNCKVLTIFGPTVPRFGFAPYGEGHSVIEHDLPCRPCSAHGSQKCPIGTHACMQEIAVAEVFACVKSVLSLENCRASA